MYQGRVREMSISIFFRGNLSTMKAFSFLLGFPWRPTSPFPGKRITVIELVLVEVTVARLTQGAAATVFRTEREAHIPPWQ